MDSIVTPVNVNSLHRLLCESNYDTAKTKFLIDGFTNGFDLGYAGSMQVRHTAPNLKLREVSSKIKLWNKIMKEVRAKRVAGPFQQIPFNYYIQSPVGLVPKDSGNSTRLIFHLSYPRKENSHSVNANTPKSLTTVKYPDFNDAIRLCMQAGRNCKISKSDMHAAFRNLGVLRKQFCLLVMKAQDPNTGKTQYFFDKAVPFGNARSCALFQAFSDCVAHLVRFRTGRDLINYLDDYLFAALVSAVCNGQMQVFMDICASINFPISLEKTCWATTQLVFLGMLIDTVKQIVMIPCEKVYKAHNLIDAVLNNPSKKLTLKQLQRICGYLNFIGKCIIPGRAFTRRLYAYTADTKLKPHHHIRVNGEMRSDLSTWKVFLENPSVFSRPFMDFSKYWYAEEICMFSDASKKSSRGFGGWCDQSWMYGIWGDFIPNCDPSIAYLELFAVVATVLNWIHRFKNRRVILFCDNKSAVDIINFTTSSCKNCMVLVRILVLHSMIHNVRVFAKYLPSETNEQADMLSRLKIAKFLKSRGVNGIRIQHQCRNRSGQYKKYGLSKSA